jgi:hypothetical protein
VPFIAENIEIKPCYKTGCIVLVLGNVVWYFSDVKNKVKAKMQETPAESGRKGKQKDRSVFTLKNKKQEPE